MKKGMTLIEVLFATAIFSFVSITLFALFKLGQIYWGRGMSYNMIQNDMKKTSTLLEKYLKQSDIKYVSVYPPSTTISQRDSIVFPVLREDGMFEYIGFFSTTDQVPPDNTGFLYFITFRPAQNFAGDPSFTPTPVTRDNISNLSLTISLLTSITAVPQKNIILLSDNVSVFDVERRDNDNLVIIRMSFLKRTIGEGTDQVVGASLFVTPMNNFQ